MKLTDDDIDMLETELYEVMADLEDLADNELIDCRDAILERVKKCMYILGEE